MADGSINFDTKLKTDEFKAQLKSLKSDISMLTKDLANLEKEHKIRLKFIQENSDKYENLKALYGKDTNVETISNKGDASFIKQYEQMLDEDIRIQDEIAQTTSQLDNLNGSVSNTEKKMASLNTKTSESQSLFSRLKNSAKSLGKIVSKLGSYLSKATKGFTKMFTSSNKTHKGLASGLKRLLMYGLGIRSLFTLFSKLKSSAKEGLGYIENSSPILKQSINTINGAFLQMKVAVASAIAPLINSLVPVITSVANAFTNATSCVANFFSALTGQKTFVKATKNAKAYAGALNDVNSANDKSLASFDEINQLNMNSSSSGGGSSQGLTEVQPTDTSFVDSLKKMWENADFSELGETLATKLRDTLNSINWDFIQGVAVKLAHSLATFINGAVGTEGLGESIGHTIAQALNTAFYFVLEFVTTLDWKQIGVTIANAITTFFQEIDLGAFAQGISTFVHGLFTLIITTLQETDWNLVGQKIGEFFSNIDWGQLVIDVSQLIGTLFSAIAQTISGWAETDEVSSALAIVLGVVAGSIGLMTIFNKVKEAVDPATTSIGGLFDKIIEGATTIGILLSLSQVINSLSNLFIAWSNSGLSVYSTLGLLLVIFGSVSVFLGVLLALVKLFTPEMIIVAGVLATLSLALEGIASVLEAVSSVLDSFKGVLEAVSGIFESWGNSVEQASNSFVDLLKGIKTYGASCIKVLPSLVSNINDLKKAVTKGSDDMTTSFSSITKNANTLNTNLSTAFNSIKTSISTSLNGIIATLNTQCTNIINKVNTTMASIKTSISTNASGIMLSVNNVLLQVVNSVNSGMTTIYTNLQSKINNIRNNLIKPIASWFNSDLVSPMNTALDSIASGFKSKLNTILGYMQTFVNSVATAMNGVINAINGIHVSIPKWVPKYGGKSYSPSLSGVSSVYVPRLATGTVIPANNGEFLAMLGDNKTDTEVVSPLETMKQAMIEALQSQGANNITIRFDGNLRQLARVLEPVIEEEKNRKGVSLVTMGG